LSLGEKANHPSTLRAIISQGWVQSRQNSLISSLLSKKVTTKRMRRRKKGIPQAQQSNTNLAPLIFAWELLNKGLCAPVSDDALIVPRGIQLSL
jgi:hypothetical protein